MKVYCIRYIAATVGTPPGISTSSTALTRDSSGLSKSMGIVMQEKSDPLMTAWDAGLRHRFVQGQSKQCECVCDTDNNYRQNSPTGKPSAKAISPHNPP